MKNDDGLDAERHVRNHRVAINLSLQTPIRIALLIMPIMSLQMCYRYSRIEMNHSTY